MLNYQRVSDQSVNSNPSPKVKFTRLTWREMINDDEDLIYIKRIIDI